MKRMKQIEVTERICDFCGENPSRPFWRCYGCGSEVCTDCSKTWCGGMGETDVHLVCHACFGKSEVPAVKTAELREQMHTEQQSIREKYSEAAEKLWLDWKESVTHERD